MAVIPIYNCFHPVLRKKTENIKEFDQDLSNLIGNMYDTMYNVGNGVGLAGNQVGESKSVIIIDTSVGGDNPRTKPITFINPEIKYLSDDLDEDFEGCLSIPDISEKVVRSKSLQLKYYDLNMKEYNQEFDGFMARVIQHEMDHLSGLLIFDRISAIKRTLLKSKMRRLQKGDIIPKYPMIQPDGELTNG